MLQKLVSAASNMQGGRKFVLGESYLISMFALAVLVIFRASPDSIASALMGVAGIAGGCATGVCGIVWGFVKEGEAIKRNGNNNGNG